MLTPSSVSVKDSGSASWLTQNYVLSDLAGREACNGAVNEGVLVCVRYIVAWFLVCLE